MQTSQQSVSSLEGTRGGGGSYAIAGQSLAQHSTAISPINSLDAILSPNHDMTTVPGGAPGIEGVTGLTGY